MYAPLLYVNPKSFMRYCMWQFGHSTYRRVFNMGSAIAPKRPFHLSRCRRVKLWLASGVIKVTLPPPKRSNTVAFVNLFSFVRQPRRLLENLVHLLPCLLTSRRFQISHRRFDIGMAQPQLHGFAIHPGHKHRVANVALNLCNQKLSCELRALFTNYSSRKIELRTAP